MYLYLLLVLFFTVTPLVSASNILNPESYLQPDRITSQQFLNRTNSTQCARQCVDGEPPMICYYKWLAEDYVTLGPACGNCPADVTACDAPQCVVANGYEKSIRTINRMVPGPSIHVCLGDRIIVDLENKISGGELTIHWHGVHQSETQHMDGVPMVTQCAILEGNVFRYDFLANNEGTHYWHSHDGLQKLDGIQGNLVIRTPQSKNFHAMLYDMDVPEHTLMILDWINTTAEERFPGLQRRLLGQLPITFLLDDRGPQKLPPGQQSGSLFPHKEVWVKSGKRFRLRLVGGLCTVCGVQFSIERHSLTLIATDGMFVAPVTVGSVNIYSGERYDFVLDANQKPGTYWIHMRGLGECSNPDEGVYQLALLRYVGTNQARSDAPRYNDGFAIGGTVLNPQNATCADRQDGVCVSQLVGLIHDDEYCVTNDIYDKLLQLKFGFHHFLNPQQIFNKGSYERYFVASDGTFLTSVINNISTVMPPSPLLSQGPDIPQDIYCPIGKNDLPQCPANSTTKGYCECVHIIKVPLGAVLDILMADVTPALNIHHTFHLHGYVFCVMDIGQISDGTSLQAISNRHANRIRNGMYKVPACKDTITVPSNGYAIVRLKADNPGMWLFHSHFMYHQVTGMALVLQVGEKNNLPKLPTNFPRCGNYQPTAYLEGYGY